MESQQATTGMEKGQKKAKRRLFRGPSHKVGNKMTNVHGGGGPENAGARPSSADTGIALREFSPSWKEFEDDFFGPAAPSNKPNLSGIPANNFRRLGDDHGGRQ